MQQRFYSIVQIFYDGMKLIPHSIVWKVDGTEQIITFLFQFYLLFQNHQFVELSIQFNQDMVILASFMNSSKIKSIRINMSSTTNSTYFAKAYFFTSTFIHESSKLIHVHSNQLTINNQKCLQYFLKKMYIILS